MKVEIKTPNRIELTPENELEEHIIRAHGWCVDIENPKPFTLNHGMLVLIPNLIAELKK